LASSEGDLEALVGILIALALLVAVPTVLLLRTRDGVNAITQGYRDAMVERAKRDRYSDQGNFTEMTRSSRTPRGSDPLVFGTMQNSG
jgi:hypothetical protein